MTAADPPPPLRADLVQTQREMLEHVARPGSWFSGAERIAIAAESRRADACSLCRERREGLSPEHAQGSHDRASALPDAIVASLRAANDKILAEAVAKDPVTKKVHDSYMSYMAKYKQWAGYSEAVYHDKILGKR